MQMHYVLIDLKKPLVDQRVWSSHGEKWSHLKYNPDAPTIFAIKCDTIKENKSFLCFK